MPKISSGVFLPTKIIKRLAEGAPTVVLSPESTFYEKDKSYLLVDATRVMGLVTMGEPQTLPLSEAAKSDHGYKPGHIKKLWPEAAQLTVWPVEYTPLAESVPLAVQGSMAYGATFKLDLDAPLLPLAPSQVEAVREAKKLAKAWAQAAPGFLAQAAPMGPATGSIVLSVQGIAQALQDALGQLHIQAPIRAPSDDFEALTAALNPLLAKLEAGLPEGDLREEMRFQAAFNRVLQAALPFTKRALPVLKLPDPLWVVKRLVAGKRAGFLSGRPRQGRVGQDQILVNELREKEGTPEVYAKPFAWAIIRASEPELVQHDELDALSLDKFTEAEWKERRDEQPWYIPLQLVRAMDPPIELREAPAGRRFASSIDLEAAGVRKQALPDPTTLDEMKADDLRRVHGELVARWEKDYKGTDRTQGREDLINAIIFVRQEFVRRGIEPPEIPEELDSELSALIGAKRDTAEIRSGSGNDLAPITLPQVLEHVKKPIRLRRGVVTIVGSLCNQGATRNDVDVLLQGPMDDGLRRVIEFRVGRSLPAHISQRVSYLHDPELGGPFTDHVEAFDLMLVPRPKFEIIEMRAEEVGKADDPLLDMPPRRGPQSMSFQFHWRGRTLHADIRFKVAKDYLVGWTMLLQKAGIPQPKNLSEAKRMAATFDPDGGTYNKDFLAPEGIMATPKSRQPIAWLHIEGEFIEPGEVGATRLLPGLIVEVPDSPEFVEFGCLPPGEMIPTERGVLPIEGILEGDRIMGSDGQAVRVHSTFKRAYKGNMLKIIPTHHSPIMLTPNHPVMAASLEQRLGKEYIRVRDIKPHLLDWKWRRADQLAPGDWVRVPRINPRGKPLSLDYGAERSIPLEGDFAWLLGLFVGDGHASDLSGQVSFYINEKDKQTQDRCRSVLQRLGYRVGVRQKRGCVSIYVSDWDLACSLRDVFYNEDRKKTVPMWICAAGREDLRSFIRGWFDADGSEGVKQYSIATTSDAAARILPWIMLHAGIPASVGRYYKRDRKARSPHIYSIRWVKHAWDIRSHAVQPKQKRPRIIDLDDGGWAMKVRSIEAVPFDGIVYNLETDDNTICLPLLTHNSQKTWFHEYFLSGGKTMNGRLMFRLLPQEREEETDLPFWRCFLSKEFLPSVLNRRAVKQKTMPPDGFSWIPVSLEKVTPKEFRYWEHKGAKAREVRDALVDARFFTEKNVRLVNGQIARVEEERKYVLSLPEGMDASEIIKEAPRAKWVLVYQSWKGQRVVRGGPTREVWRLGLDIGGKLRQFELQTDPLAEEQVSAIAKPMKGRSLWELEGDIEPGKSYEGDVWNDTKATPSSMKRMDGGVATVLESGPSMIRLRLRGKKLRGVYVLEAEEEDSPIWLWSQSEGPGQPRVEAEKAEPEMRDNVQVWDPKRIPADANRTNDRSKFRPPALFKPMKVAPRPTNEYTELEEVRQIATEGNLKAGIVVEPKLNGFRLVAEAWDESTLIFTEDEQRDLSKVLPGFTEEVKSLGKPLMLDGEGMGVDEKGNMLPRRELAQFRGKEPIDDTRFRYLAFGLLFDPKEGNQLAESYLDQKRRLAALLKGHKGKRIQLVEHRVAHTWDELKKAIEWASKQPGSEGAMFKVATSTYSLGGENDLWAKYKKTREIAAIVYDRHPVKGSPGVFNLFCAVGPVKDPKRWQETVEVGGKHYTVIGKTGNAKTSAKAGDVIVADVLEILYERDAKGRQRLHWFGPPSLVSPEPVDRKPFTTDAVINLLQPGEFKKHVDTVIGNLLQLINKADGPKEADPCYVFGEVLVPIIGTGEPPDTQGDAYSKKDVEDACYFFMKQGHKLGLMHQQYLGGKVVLLENYLMPLDVTLKDMDGNDRKIPAGTWMMKLEIVDPEVKRAVREKKLTGFSIGGTGVRTRMA